MKKIFGRNRNRIRIDELIEAKRQIDSTLHKLRETIKTFEAMENPDRYKSQITLAKRRIKAFGIAVTLIEREQRFFKNGNITDRGQTKNRICRRPPSVSTSVKKKSGGGRCVG